MRVDQNWGDSRDFWREIGDVFSWVEGGIKDFLGISTEEFWRRFRFQVIPPPWWWEVIFAAGVDILWVYTYIYIDVCLYILSYVIRKKQRYQKVKLMWCFALLYCFSLDHLVSHGRVSKTIVRNLGEESNHLGDEFQANLQGLRWLKDVKSYSSNL